jgi:NAD-dependent deacetylase
MQLKKIAVLTGAGISAESGLKTFRDAGGLWEGHRVEDVATPGAWKKNPSLVLKFYNERRQQLKSAEPNQAHKILAKLEQYYKVSVVTQNVDDLHERGGSTEVIHLHGELLKSRSEKNEKLVYPCTEDIYPGDCCEEGHQLRPHIVWFGEAVPLLHAAALKFAEAAVCIIVGTSLQVYPAAGLIQYLDPSCPVFYIDPHPYLSPELNRRGNIQLIPLTAQEGMKEVWTKLVTETPDYIH